MSTTVWYCEYHIVARKLVMMVSDGVDIEMPGGSVMTPEKVRPLIEQGRLTEQMVDEKVLNILRTCFYFDLFSHTEADIRSTLSVEIQ